MAVKIVWNEKGFRAIRTAPKVLTMLNEIAASAAATAGEGFESRPAEATGGKVRGRAAVITTTREAAAAEARDHTLLKALGNG